MDLPGLVRQAAYRTQHAGMLSSLLAAQSVLRAVARKPNKALGANVEKQLRERYEALLARDLANVAAGLYPEKLLFQMPVRDYAKEVPLLIADLPRSMKRARTRNYRDLPRSVSERPSQFPPYFRRNFHWQTDGYFSFRSARLYDVGVELLFLGTADVMRRQVIAPISRHFRVEPTRDPSEPVRILDVACGTGRFLKQLSVAHPKFKYFGLDLSPYYIQFARRNLGHLADLSLVAENAESMPFRDETFDAVTSVFLFHELPSNARQNVMREMFRVLKPGGLLVIEDSAQISESADIAPVFEQFADDFHEPFYANYVRDPLEQRLSNTGFTDVSVDPQFVSKMVVAQKPHTYARAA